MSVSCSTTISSVVLGIPEFDIIVALLSFSVRSSLTFVSGTHIETCDLMLLDLNEGVLVRNIFDGLVRSMEVLGWCVVERVAVVDEYDVR